MRTEITWASQSGSRYVMNCEVLPGWEILDVRRPGESSLPVIADWRFNPKSQRPQLTIEFLEAVTPMQTRRVQILARRMPLTVEQTMSLTCVNPLGVRSVEQFLAVLSEKGKILAALPQTELEEWNAKEFPAFVQNASFYSTLLAASPRQEVQLFYSKDEISASSLALKRSEPPYDALVDVLLDFTDAEIHETLVMSITPLDAAVERLTILTPALGEGWSWEFQSETAPAIAIAPPGFSTPESRLETGQSLEWDLRLPVPQTGSFQIVAKRELNSAGLHQVRLPFLPVARNFQGRVELSAPANVHLDVEPTFAKEELLPQGPKSAQTEILKRWHYVSPDASLIVTPLPQQAAMTSPLGRVALHSLINGYSQTNLHRVKYELEANSQHLSFPFQLPEGCELIEIRLNGQPVSPSASQVGYVLHYLPSGQKNLIELCYRTRWQANGPSLACDTPLPQTEVAILDFTWRFALSPNLQLTKAPHGLALGSAPPSPHWTSRFFGPLGQRSADDFFAPWDRDAWTAWWDSKSDQGTIPVEEIDLEFFPSDWITHEARGPNLPSTLRLELWNPAQGRQWSWVALFFSLMVGLALRIRRSAFRSQWGWFWLVCNLLGAGLLPWPWAFVCGGNVAGTLLVLFVPRALLPGSRARKTPVPMGSTASFAHRPAMNAMLLIGLGLFAASGLLESIPIRPVYGQTSLPVPDSAVNSAVPKDEAATPPVFNVMIPVDDPQSIQRVSPVVYVDRKLLRQLRAAQPPVPSEAEYLISDATFELNIDPQGSVDLLADFQLVLLNPQKPVQIAFPIENAFLGGPGHCLVDGAPHPVLAKAGVPGFFLELSPNLSPTAAVAEKPADRMANSVPLIIRHVRFSLHGAAVLFPTGGRFQFSIPPVSSSRFRATLPQSQASIKLRGMSGPMLSAENARSISGVTGSARKLELLWSQKPTELPPTTNRKANVMASATIHPLWIDWQIRVKDLPHSGTSSALWSLPRNSLVKEVKSDRLDSFQVLGENGSTRLLLKFQEPLAADSTVDIHCITPRDPSRNAPTGQVQLPALSLIPAASGDSGIPLAEYLVGVNSSPDLAIGPIQFPPNTGSEFSISTPEKFLAAYRLSASEAIGIRPPQQAVRLLKPCELTLPVELRLPFKRVRMNQEAHVNVREIRWTITAEIETTGAKSFRHVLTVPRDFTVESVSIQEDETERLVRWTKSGTRLELVLSDGTTGIQDVNLQGSIPFSAKAGQKTPLPLIQVDNAEVADSQWRVFQDLTLRHHLDVLEIEELPPLDQDGSSASSSQSKLLAAFRLIGEETSPTLWVGDPLQEAKWEMALIIEPESALGTRVSAILHLMNFHEPQETLQLRLPPVMTRDFHVESASRPGVIVPYETLPNSDQSLDLVFTSASQEPLRTLRIDSLIDLPATSAWDLPKVQVIGGQLETVYLLASPAVIVQSVDHPARPEPVPMDRLPGWFLQSKTLSAGLPGFQLFENPDASWRIAAAVAPGISTDSQVAVRTNVWLTDPKTVSGQTQLQFPAQSLESLAWQWPNGTKLKGCLFEGKELSPVIDEENEQLHLLIPARSEIKPGSTQHSLELHWSRPLASPLARFGQLELSLPKPLGLPPHDAFLTLVPTTNLRLIPQSGVHLSERHRSEPAEHLAGNEVRGELSSENSAWTIALWTMDSRTESMLLLGLVILVLGAAMNWAIRRNLADWIPAHPATVCLLLGLLWWLAFAGSVFGFVAVVASPLVAWASKRRTRTLSNGLSQPMTRD